MNSGEKRFDSDSARGSQATSRRHETSANDLLGHAALSIWGDFPRDIQEALFEAAVRDFPDRRQDLAKLLHDYHPRTEHARSGHVVEPDGSRYSDQQHRPS